jgi:hypothetical protein
MIKTNGILQWMPAPFKQAHAEKKYAKYKGEEAGDLVPFRDKSGNWYKEAFTLNFETRAGVLSAMVETIDSNGNLCTVTSAPVESEEYDAILLQYFAGGHHKAEYAEYDNYVFTTGTDPLDFYYSKQTRELRGIIGRIRCRQRFQTAAEI